MSDDYSSETDYNEELKRQVQTDDSESSSDSAGDMYLQTVVLPYKNASKE